MKKLMTLNYLETTEEAKIKALSSFHEMDFTTRMDLIIDAIHELENMRAELHNIMYPKDEEKNDELN